MINNFFVFALIRLIGLLLYTISHASIAEDELQHFIQHSLQHSPHLESAKQSEIQARAQQQAIKAEQHPQLDLNIGIGIENSDTPNTRFSGLASQTLNRQELHLHLEQNLYDAGKRHFQIEAQAAQIQSQQWQHLNIQNQLSLKLIKAYLQLAERQQLLELAKDDLVAHQKTEKQMRQRYEQGAGRKADVEQVTSRKARTTVRLLQIEGEVIEAQIQLQSLSGQDIHTLKLNSQWANTLKKYLPKNKKLALTALIEHPQLQQAQAQVDNSLAHYQQSRSHKYPQINLEIDARHYNNIDGIQGENQELSAMLRLRYNLYQGGKQQAQEAAAIAAKAQKQADYQILWQQLEEQLRLSWQHLKTSQKRQDYLQQHQASSKAVWQSYQKQFKLGRSSLIVVLDAETEWYHAHAEVIKGHYALQQAIFNLFAAIGNLNSFIQKKTDS